MTYTYGMRLRGFAPGCQPIEGLIMVEYDTNEKYHALLTYNRELTEAEIREYELDDLMRIRSEQRVGKWVSCEEDAGMFNNRCSECGRSIGYWNPKPVYSYCPFCGVRIEEEQDA